MLDLMKTFDFEEQPIRGVRLNGEPWLVAADVCRALGLENARQAVSRLDDDEKAIYNLKTGSDEVQDLDVTSSDGIRGNTVGNNDGIRGNPNVNIISESGFYALVFTSTKPEARRFRKWVTGTVLPALRKTGTYTDPGFMGSAPERAPIDFMARQDVSNWLSMVREARLLRGPRAAIQMWEKSPLPTLDDDQPTEKKDKNDPFLVFFAECCDVTGDVKDSVSSRALWQAFVKWAADAGQPPLRDRIIYTRIKDMSRNWRCPRTGKRFTARETGQFNGYDGLILL